MQFEFKLKIGKTEFVFKEDAATPKEFFEKASFYTELPTVGPNGEDDLELSFRTTQKGYTYYSIVSKSAGKEYAFGQSADNEGLFPKGWKDLFIAQTEDGEEEEAPKKSNKVKKGLGSTKKAKAKTEDEIPTPPAVEDDMGVDDDIDLSEFGIEA